MAICLTFSNGSLVQSPQGIGECTDYVLLTASDYAQATPSLTLADTVELSSLIITVWALAYSIKLIRRAL